MIIVPQLRNEMTSFQAEFNERIGFIYRKIIMILLLLDMTRSDGIYL